MTAPAGRPQAAKLGLATGVRVALDGAPATWALSEPPPGLEWVNDDEPADVLIAFIRQAAELPGRLPSLGRRIFPAGMLWIAWPRRAGGHASDLTDEVVRRAVLPTGLVDTKVAALDDDWSSLRFVWRKELRVGGLPPPG